MCPKRLPEPANAGPLAGGRRASLARRAEHARSHGTGAAQQVKLVVRSAQPMRQCEEVEE